MHSKTQCMLKIKPANIASKNTINFLLNLNQLYLKETIFIDLMCLHGDLWLSLSHFVPMFPCTSMLFSILQQFVAFQYSTAISTPPENVRKLEFFWRFLDSIEIHAKYCKALKYMRTLAQNVYCKIILDCWLWSYPKDHFQIVILF